MIAFNYRVVNPSGLCRPAREPFYRNLHLTEGAAHGHKPPAGDFRTVNRQEIHQNAVHFDPSRNDCTFYHNQLRQQQLYYYFCQSYNLKVDAIKDVILVAGESLSAEMIAKHFASAGVA